MYQRTAQTVTGQESEYILYYIHARKSLSQSSETAFNN
jgi:hypothetical protein